MSICVALSRIIALLCSLQWNFQLTFLLTPENKMTQFCFLRSGCLIFWETKIWEHLELREGMRGKLILRSQICTNFQHGGRIFAEVMISKLKRKGEKSRMRKYMRIKNGSKKSKLLNANRTEKQKLNAKVYLLTIQISSVLLKAYRQCKILKDYRASIREHMGGTLNK